MRRRAASALAFALISACKADDQVLTPDEETGRDAASGDAAMPVLTSDGGAQLVDASAPIGADAGGSLDASNGSPATDAAIVEGDASSSGDAAQATHTAKDPDCDLNGLWIGRQVTESVALAVVPQFANNWYYLEFTQDGEQVVVSRHMDCGMEVHGSAVVELAEGTTRALIGHNRQTGRKGTFAKQSDGSCAFSLEKFWSVRGVNEGMYAPNPRNRDATIQQLQAENPLPVDGMASEDWDDDSNPGIAFQVAGLGARNSAQRDWTRWFSAPSYEVMAAADFQTDFLVRAEFSNEEVIYMADNPLLWATSEPNAGAAHTLALRFLGRTRDDPRAQALLKADDFQTCLAIQAALPALEDRLK